MNIHTLFPKEFAANTYFITGKEGTVVIDPAQPRALEEAKRLGLEVRYALLTHAHFDHLGGCAAMHAAGAKIGCLDRERNAVAAYNVALQIYGEEGSEVPLDFTFSDEEVLSLCGLEVRVIATPGHTMGSCCLLIRDGEERALFSGDTLFRGDVGNTERSIERMRALEASLEKLSKLENCTVYPGHGPTTTIDEEKKNGILPM